LFPLKAARAAMHHARYAADKDERFGDSRRISDSEFALLQIRSVTSRALLFSLKAAERGETEFLITRVYWLHKLVSLSLS